MVSLLEVQQCVGWCGKQYFSQHFQGWWVVLLAFVSLSVFYVFRNAYAQNWFGLKEQVSEERAEMIVEYCLHFTMLLLAGFLLYWLFWFKPETVGRWVAENGQGLVDSLQNDSTLKFLQMYS